MSRDWNLTTLNSLNPVSVSRSECHAPMLIASVILINKLAKTVIGYFVPSRSSFLFSILCLLHCVLGPISSIGIKMNCCKFVLVVFSTHLVHNLRLRVLEIYPHRNI